jgi:hypothetical protein
MRTTTLIALLTLASAPISHGQVRVIRYGDDRLAGITQVDVLVRLAPDASGRCSVDRAAIEALSVNVLREGGVKATLSLKALSWFYSVVISAAVSGIGSYCAASVTTELLAHVEGIPEADRSAPPGTWGSRLVGEMPLVRYTDLVTTPVQEHDAAVRRSLQTRLTMLSEKLRAANP